ncbi:MAG: hypothetical protein WA280_08220 [Xanthobacteraceae bacterium]
MLLPIRPQMREGRGHALQIPLQVARGSLAAIEPRNAEDRAHAKETSIVLAIQVMVDGPS